MKWGRTSFRSSSRTAIAIDTVWAASQEALTLIAALAVLGVLVVGLGPEQFGQFAAVQVLASTLATLCTAWVTLLVFQQVRQMGISLQDSFAKAVGYLCICALGAYAIAVGIALTALSAIPLAVTMAIVGAELMAVCSVQLTAAIAQLEAGVPAAARIRMTLVAGRLLIVLALGATGTVDLHIVAFGILATYIVVAAAVFCWGLRRYALHALPARPRWADIRQGAPHLGVLAALSLQEDSDKIFMVRLTSPVDAGLYAAAYRVASVGQVPIRALINANHLRFLDDSGTQPMQHTRRALRYTVASFLYSVVAGLALYILADPITAVLGTEYLGTAPIIKALALVTVFRGLSLVPLNSMLGVQRYGRRFAVIFVSSVIAVAGYISLIPQYSYWGAIAATLISEAALLVMVWVCLIVSDVQRDRTREPGGCRHESMSSRKGL